MKYSVDEKLKYNRERKTLFGWGYVLGVKQYRRYGKVSKAEQKLICEEINDNAAKAKTEKVAGVAKGFMCGVRDAANERKAKQKGIPP